MKFISIKSKLTIAFMALLVFTVVTLGITGHFVIKSYLENQYRAELKSTSLHIAREIEDILSENKELLLSIAAGKRLENYHIFYNDKTIEDYFGQFRYKFPVLSYAGKDGHEELKLIEGHYSGNLLNYSKSAVFRDAIKFSDKVAVSPLVQSPDIHEPVINLILATYESGNAAVSGAVIAQYPVTMLSNYLSQFKVGKSGYSCILDKDGKVIVHNFDNTDSSVDNEIDLSPSHLSEAGFQHDSVLGLKGLVAYASVKSMGWTVRVTLPIREFESAFSEFYSLNFAVLFIIFLVGLAFSSVISRKIAGPIIKIASSTREIAKGDFAHKSDIQTNDEIGILAASFNEMAAQIKINHDALRRSRDELELKIKERTAELSQSNDQLQQEIAEKQSSEKRLAYIAYYDALTNLPNRTLFEDRVEQVVAVSDRHDVKSALLFVDIDDFKRINDTLGHVVGDELLMGIADRLRMMTRKGDSISRNNEDPMFARVGGDEFTVLLSVLKQSEDAAKVAQRIIDSLTQPFVLSKQEVFMTVSIGIALFPDDGSELFELWKNADTAMYYAKNKGKNNYQYYKKSMNDTAADRLALESDLRRALEREELLLHYQPQIDSLSGKIIGVEALIRWQHPERGMISPLEFIPLAEETGLIVPISNWVLETACIQSRRWQDKGYYNIPISVNLTSHHFQRSTLIYDISELLKKYGLQSSDLILEMTESAVMEDTEMTLNNFRDLTKMGLRLSIDDFGTGYSSLSYLKRFPIHAIKIDRTFVKDVNTEADDGTIANTIITMAHSLKMHVVAEGVETEDQLRFLLERGCDELQGYLFSSPQTVEDVEKLLASDKEGTGIYSSFFDSPSVTWDDVSSDGPSADII
jgi:diguanylate cyclase (GGDEF)-like protein